MPLHSFSVSPLLVPAPASGVALSKASLISVDRGRLLPSNLNPIGVSTSERNRKLVKCRATAKVDLPSQRLSGSELDTWNSNVALLESLGFSQEDSDELLGRAFGWINRGYWADTIVDKMPDPEATQGVILYLNNLGLEGDNLKKVIRDFPYVLACDVEKRLKPNVSQLDREWAIRGPSLKNVLLRSPNILGYTVDCKGDCISECDYCWARF